MSVITRIKNIANKNYCPLDNTSGPIEWLQFKNWAKEPTMEIPRGCLEHLKIRDYVRSVGEDLGDELRWISSEEKKLIQAHHHTKIMEPTQFLS